MPTTLILINGLPAAGKSTLAARLAAATGYPMISKDAIKESLPPAPDVGVRASQAQWPRAAAVEGGVILESWWFKPRDLGYVEAGLALVPHTGAVEIWCAVPPDVALDRFRRRLRPFPYDDEASLARWPEWAAGAEPLGLTPVIRVDTTGPVDVPALVVRARAAAAAGR